MISGFILVSIVTSIAIQPITPLVVNSAFDRKLVRMDQESIDAVRISKIARNNVATSGATFLFNFKCSPQVNQTLCSWAKSGFEAAGNRIAQALTIKNTIVVDAKFHSLCAPSGCTSADRNTLGRASSAAYFAARNSQDPQHTYYYPQALVKQLKTSDSLSYAQQDIFAEFSSEFPFWFKQSGVPIGPNQTDFEFVVAHELTHGLGLDSGWVSYASYYQKLTSSNNYLAPLPFAQGSNQDTAVVSAMSPLTIFDKFLVSASGESYAKYGEKVAAFPAAGLKVPEFVGLFEKSGPAIDSAKAAMAGAVQGDSNPLTFKSADGSTTIPLNSPPVFQPGTSIVHVHSRLATTADFLMIPAIKPLVGKTLDQIMASANTKTIYGPSTLAIMSSIGWPTPQNPAIQTLMIERDFGRKSGASRVKLELVTALTIFLSMWL